MKSRMLVIAVVLLAVVVAVAAPAQAKWASNVHIVFFPGGPAGRRFRRERLQRRKAGGG